MLVTAVTEVTMTTGHLSPYISVWYVNNVDTIQGRSFKNINLDYFMYLAMTPVPTCAANNLVIQGSALISKFS